MEETDKKESFSRLTITLRHRATDVGKRKEGTTDEIRGRTTELVG